MKKQVANRDEVRAFYESNGLSHKDVAEHFNTKGFTVSWKTIESWSGKDSWMKNYYGTHEVALEQIKGNKNKKTETVDPNDLSVSVLTRSNLVNEISLNLDKAREITMDTDSIQVRKIYQEMLLKMYDRVRGEKDSDIDTTPRSEISPSKPLADMTLEELYELKDSL